MMEGAAAASTVPEDIAMTPQSLGLADPCAPAQSYEAACSPLREERDRAHGRAPKVHEGFDLLRVPGMRRLLLWGGFPYVFQAAMLAVFIALAVVLGIREHWLAHPHEPENWCAVVPVAALATLFGAIIVGWMIQ